MPSPGQGSGEAAEAPGALARLAEQSQLDFELDFFGKLLSRNPDHADALRAYGNDLTLKGRYLEGLEIDRRLIALKPNDPVAYYNLACSYALLKKPDLAIKTLRRAVELGYHDFRYMLQDKDLGSIRGDPRFQQLLREFQTR
jgi:tetratricopeptide (TPR) repeat protein